MSDQDALEEDATFLGGLAQALAEDKDMEGEAAEAMRSQAPHEPEPLDTFLLSRSDEYDGESGLEIDGEFFNEEEERLAKKLKLHEPEDQRDIDDIFEQLPKHIALSPPRKPVVSDICDNIRKQHVDGLSDPDADLELADEFRDLEEYRLESKEVRKVIHSGGGDCQITLELPTEAINDDCGGLGPASVLDVESAPPNPGQRHKTHFSTRYSDRLTSVGDSIAPPSAQEININTARVGQISSSEHTLTTHLSSSGWVPAISLVATRFDGTQIRIPRRQKLDLPLSRASKSQAELQKQSMQLLDQPIHRMLASVHNEILAKKEPSDVSNNAIANISTEKGTLWTDRYRPKKFIDLIGDERVFRNAMSWLKSWDKCVFKRFESVKRKRLIEAQQNNSKFHIDSTNAAEPDPWGRPQEKVLLLAGKPGLGKTTMAEVLAEQAGYQVIEINASDDRNAKTVTERIKNALETRTLDGAAKAGGGLSLKDNRPCCVIIDEIDGAGGARGGGAGSGAEIGFVHALVKLVMDGSNVKKSTTSFTSKSRKIDHRPLLRPIICICNDLYAPVLRPLRPISRIIRFSNPSTATIIPRLQTICRSEQLVADLRNLTYLAKLASGDLRSCLNTLQFIKTQTDLASDQSIKAAIGVGLKDTGSSVQAVLSKVFKLPLKKQKPEGPRVDQADSSYLTSLITDISTCGEYDRITQGCFENYLAMKPPTDIWRTYQSLYEWLGYYDRLSAKVYGEQTYELMNYMPYSIAAWRELMGSLSNKTPEYTKVDYEMFQKRAVNEEILHSFNQSITPSVKSCFKTREVNSELIPMLMRIISVDLKPVNSQLIKREEKEIMMRIVSIMLDLGLKFQPDKGEDGQLTYVLEPQIDYSVHYDGKRALDIPPPRFAVRQMIAREMDVVSIRRHEGAGSMAGSGAAAILEAYEKKPSKLLGTKPAEKVAVDFFGRSITDAGSTTLHNSQGERIPPKVNVLYRFHEGFSNAVKKPIKFSELLSK